MIKVLITGAGSGIGLHLAKCYLARGEHVVACGRDVAKLTNAFVGISTDKVTLCVCDIAQRDNTLLLLQQHKNLDLVILNAGVCEYIDDAKAFDSALFNRVIQTNVMGTGHCLEACIPNINRGGQIAIVSSAATLLPLTRAEAYGASKAALDYLTRTLAIDLSPQGIAVSLIRPGFVDTPLTQKNNFSMPGLTTVDKACKKIIAGLDRRKRLIEFPRGFFWTLRFLALLPSAVWHVLAVKMVRDKNAE